VERVPDSGAGALPTGELELPVQRADTPDEDGTATDNTGEDGSGANETGTENRSETDSGGETAASAGGSLQQLGRGIDELFDNAHANNTRRGRGGRGRGGTRPSSRSWPNSDPRSGHLGQFSFYGAVGLAPPTLTPRRRYSLAGTSVQQLSDGAATHASGQLTSRMFPLSPAATRAYQRGFSRSQATDMSKLRP